MPVQFPSRWDQGLAEGFPGRPRRFAQHMLGFCPITAAEESASHPIPVPGSCGRFPPSSQANPLAGRCSTPSSRRHPEQRSLPCRQRFRRSLRLPAPDRCSGIAEHRAGRFLSSDRTIRGYMHDISRVEAVGAPAAE